MTTAEWAENEVRIACKRERASENVPEGEWDYGCACYESALKAYKCLSEDGHSGTSWGFAKGILMRLMDGDPLTPIEDVPEVWGEPHVFRDGTKSYQCKRQFSLFKKVHPDGTVTYSDSGRAVGYYVDRNYGFGSGFINKLIDELYPIKMPYYAASRPYKVYVEDFLCNPDNGDYDTMGILYLITPDGERVEINRFSKDSETDDTMVPITKEEYEYRKAHQIVKEEN